MKKFYVVKVKDNLIFVKSAGNTELDAVKNFNLRFLDGLDEGGLAIYTRDEYIEWLNLNYRDDYEDDPEGAKTFEEYIQKRRNIDFDSLSKASIVIDASDGSHDRIYTDADGEINYEEALSFAYKDEFKIRQYDEYTVMETPNAKFKF